MDEAPKFYRERQKEARAAARPSAKLSEPARRATSVLALTATIHLEKIEMTAATPILSPAPARVVSREEYLEALKTT